MQSEDRGNLQDQIDFIERAEDLANGLGSLANRAPVARGAYQAFCRIVAGTPGFTVLNAIDIRNVCTPYLDELNRTFGDDVLQFTGGQCDNELYDITYDHDLFNPFSGQTTPVSVSTAHFGPLGALQPTDAGNGTQLTARTGPGQPVGTVQDQTYGDGFVVSNIRNVVATRRDGNPDNCGDGAELYQPGDGYGGETFGNPVTYTDPQTGNNFDITVGPPSDDGAGGFSIPVEVGDISLEIGPTSAGGGGGSSSGPGPTEAGAPILGTPQFGDLPIPMGPPGSICVAIAVTILSIPGTFGSVANTAPNRRFFSPIGNVSVLLSADDGEAYWSRDEILFEEETVVSIPVEGLSITRFRINNAPGLGFSVVPLYRTDTPE